jgi:hypothetical protein
MERMISNHTDAEGPDSRMTLGAVRETNPGQLIETGRVSDQRRRQRSLRMRQFISYDLAGGIARNAADDVDVSGLFKSRNLALQVLP